MTGQTGQTGTLSCTDPLIKKRGANCQCCQLVSNLDYINSNGFVVNTAGGNCKSTNIVYGATCLYCVNNNVYVGKTVMSLRDRVNAHRSSFYKILESASLDSTGNVLEIDDTNILGYHIFSTHDKFDRSDFNNCYKFDIICNAAPSNIRVLEQFYIDKLKTHIPYGFNQINSIF